MLTTLLMDTHQDNGYHTTNECLRIPSANFKVLEIFFLLFKLLQLKQAKTHSTKVSSDTREHPGEVEKRKEGVTSKEALGQHTTF